MSKLSTDAYKGVRDFFPEDQAVQNYIFSTWRKVVESYGYEEYNASILEPAELYRSKTSEEIVNEQTYTFTDRGDREVTLRPEMTPTVARMVAARRRELGFPLRWYSVPNLFRYERPQRGRLREHWQLNVDIFGMENSSAELEVITVASHIMEAFGAQQKDFEVRLGSRAMHHTLFTDCLAISEEERKELTRLIDGKEKMEPRAFEESLQRLLKGSADMLIGVYESTTIDELVQRLPDCVRDTSWIGNIRILTEGLERSGIKNVRFSPTLMRGFEYYTGIVFEVFDTNTKNPRSIFGGGRYDNLLELFGGDKVPAVGFGLGDVTMRDFLETHDLLPALASTTDVMICFEDSSAANDVQELASALRKECLNVAVYEGKKQLGEQRQIAEKKRIPFTLTLETKDGAVKTTLKELTTGTETVGTLPEIVSVLRESASRPRSSAI